MDNVAGRDGLRAYPAAAILRCDHLWSRPEQFHHMQALTMIPVEGAPLQNDRFQVLVTLQDLRTAWNRCYVSRLTRRTVRLSSAMSIDFFRICA